MSRRLVYVADDDPDLRDLYLETLEAGGHEAFAFPDGMALLERVAQRRPDLILLDINMPGMTGWQVNARLKEDPSTAGIPVVAVTAQGGASIESSAIRTLKFTGYVRKPFRLAELLDRVETSFGPSKGEDAGA